MEKIKLNDGTIFDIVSGSYEYVNIIAPSIDEVVSCFTDDNLKYCEILADIAVNETEFVEGEEEVEVVTEEIARAVFSNKHMKDFRASYMDGNYDIVITLEDFDEVAGRLAALEEAQMVHEEAIVELASLLG